MTRQMKPESDLIRDNLRFWTQMEQTDPRFTKKITGRQYQGTSVNPTYIAQKLTAAFGPAGIGWGTVILDQQWHDFGSVADKTYERMHVVTMRLWTNCDASKGIEQCGQTKVAYFANSGKFMNDDDGAKKSVTDAFVKCASLCGAAADIFLGRWDDAKYQSDLMATYGGAENPVVPSGLPKSSRPAPATALITDDF